MPRFDFGEFPVLMAERISLCEHTSDDVDDIFLIRSDAEVQRYNSVPDQTVAHTLKCIAEAQEKYRSKTEITWSVRLHSSRRVIGGVSVFDWKRYHRRAKVGYDLARDCWGKGYAQEAIRAVLRFAFESMQLNRMEIWTSTANARSLKLAARLGFTREGSLRRRILEDDGQFHDGAVFGLLHDEWSAGQGDAA
jgi:ribosomal-protein-alanine N-acetyltransferase